MMMTVRRAEWADVPAAVAMIKRHHADEGFAFAFDAPRVSLFVQRAIADPDYCVFVCRHGLLIGTASESPFTGQRIASELIIRAEAAGVCAALLAAFAAWARERGCEVMRVSAIGRHDAASRLWSRYGFRLDETIYAKAI